ncbi:unnamed protein product, partial [Musa banksii]
REPRRLVSPHLLVAPPSGRSSLLAASRPFSLLTALFFAAARRASSRRLACRIFSPLRLLE